MTRSIDEIPLTDGIAVPPPPPKPPASKRLGKAMSLAMVVGTVIGSGIYVLPATVASFGPNVIAAFALTILGTMTLALTLAALARRIPGGPYNYVAAAFGDRVAFVTMWSYLVAVWTAIAAVAIAAGGALGHLFPAIASGSGLTIFAVTAVLVLTLVNLRGARSAGTVQVIATLIKIVPLLLVVLLVLGRLGTGLPLEPLADVPLSVGGMIGAAALMLFAFTGFETAALSANVTDDAETAVPKATVRGTIFVALIYLAATLSVLLLLPSAVASHSSAPFADATAPTLGALAGALVTIIAAISALGTGNSQILVGIEIMRSIANAGDLPPMFARTNRAGVSVASLLVSAVVAILLILASNSDSFVELFSFVAVVSAVAALVLYAVCAAAALKVKSSPVALAGLALVYAIAMFFGAGREATLWGLGLALAGLPIRYLSRRFSSAATSPAAGVVPSAPQE